MCSSKFLIFQTNSLFLGNNRALSKVRYRILHNFISIIKLLKKSVRESQFRIKHASHLKDKIFTIHHQNIRSLAIEMHEAVNNLPGGNLSEFFVGNNHNYNLCSRSELTIPSINTVFKGQDSINYFGSVIWNSIPAELREISSFQVFKSEIKAWRPTKYPCRLCKNYIENLGFVSVTS